MKVRIALVASALLLASSVGWPAGDGTLIKGLDGGDYQPYKAAVIKRVQAKLAELGLYDGPADGKLNQDTFEALGQFQKDQGLPITGIPTPRTRELLERATGSSEEEPPLRECG